MRILVCLFLVTFLVSAQVPAGNDILKISEDEFGNMIARVNFDEVLSLDFTSAILASPTDVLSITKTADKVVFPLFFLSSEVDFANLIPVYEILQKMKAAAFDKRQGVVIEECILQLNDRLKIRFCETSQNLPEKNPIEFTLRYFLDEYSVSATKEILKKCYIKSRHNDAEELSDAVKEAIYFTPSNSFEFFHKLIITETMNNLGNNELLISDVIDAYSSRFFYCEENKWLSSSRYNLSFDFIPDHFIDMAFFKTVKIKSSQTDPLEILKEFTNFFRAVMEISEDDFKRNVNDCVYEFYETLTDQDKMNAFTDKMNVMLKNHTQLFIKEYEIPTDEFNSALSSKFVFPVTFKELSQNEQQQCLGEHLSNGNVSVPFFTTKEKFIEYVEEEMPSIQRSNSVNKESSPNPFFTKFIKQLFDDRRIKKFLDIAEDPSATITYVMPSAAIKDDNLQEKVKSFKQPNKNKVDTSIIITSCLLIICLGSVVTIIIVSWVKIKASKASHSSKV